MERTTVIGQHLVAELCDCNKNLINDRQFVETAISIAVAKSGATLLKYIDHVFEPQGLTSLALLSESHISFHSYPEYDYAAVDIFTCGNCSPEIALDYLSKAFKSKDPKITKIQREVHHALQNV